MKRQSKGFKAGGLNPGRDVRRAVPSINPVQVASVTRRSEPFPGQGELVHWLEPPAGWDQLGSERCARGCMELGGWWLKEVPSHAQATAVPDINRVFSLSL